MTDNLEEWAFLGLERVAVVGLGLNLRGPQTPTESAVLQKTHLGVGCDTRTQRAPKSFSSSWGDERIG